MGSLIGGGILLAAFILWESHVKAPLLPLRLFRDRSFTVANLVGITFSFGVFGAVFILIQFLQIVQGHTPLEAGILTMPWTLAPMVVAPLTGLFSSRTGTRLPITLGLVLLTIAIGWIALVISPTAPYSAMWPAFALAGIGMGFVFAPSSTAVLANMVPADHAKASGTNSTLREIGVALGIAVLTAVFTGAGGQLTPTGYVSAAIPAVFVGAAVLGLSALISLALPSRKKVEALRVANELRALGALEVPGATESSGEPQLAGRVNGEDSTPQTS
jgi:MFS family permease